MMIRLHPVSGTEMSNIGGTELLRMECTERPDLDLPYTSSNDDSNNNNNSKVNQKPSIISLGKNSFTMIADPTLPRNAVDVVVELSDDEPSGTSNEENDGMGLGDTIRLLADSSTFSFEQTPSSANDSPETNPKQPKLRLRIHRYIGGFVAINNETVTTPNAIIKEGDILSLQSMSYSYDYVVMMAPISESTTATTETASTNAPLSVSPSDNDISEPLPAVSSTNQHYLELVDQQQKLMQQMVNDEFTCAICLEYQVQSTALVPCGHSFCNTCIVDSTRKKLKLKICSVCNTKITSVVPNRTIDSCFHLMVQFQSDQNKKQEEANDETLSSSYVPILPQEDLEHYMERSEEQMNVRMNSDTNRRSKRHRSTPDAVRLVPPVPPANLDERPMARLQAMMFHGTAWQENFTIDENNDRVLRPENALFRLYPRTPAVVAQGGRPPTVSLVHGSTPTDAIEID
jgi:Zinc finger, C3HC4 type (RING finger)